ncbi:ATP-binding protein [Polyangium sp. 15x6]|uniref:AAA family ATPase n=1 Tax=Polyangium sp. 15x6 TaxID=3042687 RepID=UPI00249BF296|nr:ATP-binding protein [Polyangium sp. 15x6]MDI3289586.1 ATP-binding protein [Polyangium sp. 15x6]
MSPPTALLVARYRAFAGEETLPLRPLTLLYGRNNSGKSALARALAIIGASVTEAAKGALVTLPEIIREGDFTDLAWQGDAGDYTFDIGLRWDDGEVREVRYTLDGGSGRPSYVKELLLRGADGRVLWAGLTPPAPGRPMRPQTGHSGGEQRLAGLVPLDSDVPVLQGLAARMKTLHGRVRWIDGVRARPARVVKRTGTAPANLRPDGSNAASFLVEQPELVEEIGRFYADLTPARELEVREVLDLGHRITLNPKNRASFRIDLVDTGEGMAQVLPVLVAVALAARGGPSALLAVEEPESHLHPDAQAVLARYLCRVAGSEKPPTLVMETHSRVFLLGIQLAVAQGRLPCDRVGLAWVDQDAEGRSTITPVELSPSGHPREGWPIAAFAEDLRLASDLARLDIARGP